MAEKNADSKKVIFSMVNVSKLYDKKAVLKDIYLSYYYGAKIGVLGRGSTWTISSCSTPLSPRRDVSRRFKAPTCRRTPKQQASRVAHHLPS